LWTHFLWMQKRLEILPTKRYFVSRLFRLEQYK
jgi:hypothetical protein